MIEIDIMDPSDDLKFYIKNIWPDDKCMYIYDDVEHFFIKCDVCLFRDGKYTIILKYDDRAFIRLDLYKEEFGQVHMTRIKEVVNNDSMKEKILEYFKDINHAYNDCTKFDTLKRMLEQMEGTNNDC